MRDREKAAYNHSKHESISNNGEVELIIEQVRMRTRRSQNIRKPMDEKLEKIKQKDRLSETNVLNNA